MNIKKSFKFNTGRHYTDDGQEIRVIVSDDNQIMFSDDSRNINGQFAFSGHRLPEHEYDISRIVMHRYDDDDFWYQRQAEFDELWDDRYGRLVMG
jgi:hypothetical protein